LIRSAQAVAHAMAICAALGGCTAYRAQPLVERPPLAPSVADLDRTRPGGPPISAERPLMPSEVALLALQNSPDLQVERSRRGIAQAQVTQAGLLPDPLLSGAYSVLLPGPGIANAVAATLTSDVTSLITLSARRRAAREAALQVDANLIWQEWQTMSRAQTLAIDLVQQGRLLGSYEQALGLLRHRASITMQAVGQGNVTLQMLAPDVAAVTGLQTQLDAAILAQQERWQALDALLGLEPQVRPRLATSLRVIAITPAEADQMLADLPQRRPDLIALQLGYRSQEANLRAAVLGQFPALALGPNYGNDTGRVRTLGPSVTLSLPLFNRNRGAIAIQSATREQLRAEYAARLATATGGARALLANLATLERQLAAARGGLGEAERLAAGAERTLRAGLLDELSYVQLITARLEKERQVIGLEQQVLDTRVALATLLGAGLPPVRLPPPEEPGFI